MAWFPSMKFKQRILVFSIITLFLIIAFLIHFDLNTRTVKCLKFFNESSRTRKPTIHFSNVEIKPKIIPFVKTDNFPDLVKYVRELRSPTKTPASFREVILIEKIDPDNPNLAEMIGVDIWENMTYLAQFQLAISKQDIYRENDPLVDAVLNDLATLPIQTVSRKKYGTQVKFVLDFGYDRKALFKPQRLKRDEETDPNHYYFQELERHNSEIAAYHLDKALNFRRVMPVVGRFVNVTSELYNLGNSEVRKTFFTSPANNKCFYGNCTYYCSILSPVCGNPDMIEGSLGAYLPEFEEGYVWEWMHPWRRSYSFKKRAAWQDDPDYCIGVKKQPLYVGSRKLLDVMDLIVFDFLMGNLDRHHYEYFTIWGNDSTTVHLDNGRGFGKAYEDDYTILTGIIQCCIIRETTLKTLLNFHNGPKPLSQIMRESLSKDPIAPVLAEQHLIALDRRVQIILQELRKCVNEFGKKNVTSKTDSVSDV